MQITAARTDKQTYEQQRVALHRKSTRLGLAVNRLRLAVKEDQSTVASLREELTALEAKKKEMEVQLAEVRLPPPSS